MVVRFMVADDPHQAEQVRELFRVCEQRREQLLVTLPVLIETIWVLSSVYDCPRAQILDAIETLSRLPFLKFERAECLRRLIDEGRSSSVDLADLLIGLAGQAQGCESTLTFDRSLKRSSLFEILQ